MRAFLSKLKLEQTGNHTVFVYVDALGGGHLGQAGHGSPRDLSRGGPDFISMLGGSEFRLRQGFAPQNACTPHARRNHDHA